MAKVLADGPADVDVGAPEVLAKGFHDYLRYRLTLRSDGYAPLTQKRDVFAGGQVVAVLPVDLARDEIVLIRQFRLPAHLATGKGDMIEIVAGGVEDGETPEDAARRECQEEIGVAPDAMAQVLTFMTTPGVTDETIILYLAAIDAARVPERAGALDEGEQIATIRVSIDAAIAAVNDGGLHNGPLILALQWLALNRARLGALLGQAEASS